MGIDDHDTFTGLTPLQQACLDGNIEKVLELVDAGADVDIQANGEMAGKTAAMIAASEGSTDILKAMNRGPSLLNLKDADGGTAAMTAAVHKHGSVLDYVRPVFFPPPGPKRRSAIAPRARAALPRARASGIDRDPRRASSPRPNPRAEVRAPRPPRASTPRQPAIAPIAEVRVSTREKKTTRGFPALAIRSRRRRFDTRPCARGGAARPPVGVFANLGLLLPLLLPGVDILSPLLPLPPSKNAAHREEGRPERDGPGRVDGSDVRRHRRRGGGGWEARRRGR